jgi:excinuclease ABC subunit A
MPKPAPPPVIHLRGVRQNNLKGFDLDLPLRRLIVITGLSGSGKSSLAFDTLFAEGQRRYIETFSPYARQFFDRMDKPRVDSIEGIPPAIAIEQRNAVRTTRSTVGTMTEICDYMKALWPHVAQLHCRQCGQPVRKEPPQRIWETLSNSAVRSPKSEVLITFDLPLSEKLSLEESLALIAKQGYQRILFGGQILRIEDAQQSATGNRQTAITVVQDRLRLAAANRGRFVEACEQAYHFGKGKLAIHHFTSTDSGLRTQDSRLFSNRLHCARCDIEYREPSAALFSFNHPLGACPACKGFGRVISIDYDLAIPDRSLTLAGDAVKPWRSGFSAECQQDLLRACRHFEIPTGVPFEKLPKKWQDFVIEGEPDYGIDEEHEWPRAWYGVKGYFRWLETKAYKMHVRVLLSRYRAYTTCPDCQGARFQPETLLYRVPVGADVRRLTSKSEKSEPPHVGSYEKLSLADFYALPIRDALAVVEQLSEKFGGKERSPIPNRQSPIQIVLQEVRSRLGYLNDVGLGYLTLDRPTRTLSGGETERVNLTTCLGTRLVNTLFVLDEPSVGLHPRDTARLVRILQQLRDAGNTVVVVEHEASVMRAADQIVDLGPGHGATGGQVVFQGTFAEILNARNSLTGQYLSRRKQIEIPQRRPVAADVRRLTSKSEIRNPRSGMERSLVTSTATNDSLRIKNATRHNLRDLTLGIPLNRFVCVTGVSGSGKTTLVREILLPALEASLKSEIPGLKSKTAKASERMENEKENDDENGGPRETRHATSISGHEHLGRVVLVDQSILGKTPRSNPAVYIGAFDDIREFFAQSEPAQQRGFNASAFSFNSSQGQCERCRGAGFEKIEMQFLSDVFIRCPDCDGRRYRQHILEVKIRSSRREEALTEKSEVRSSKSELNQGLVTSAPAEREWSIADLLDATVDEVMDFLDGFPESKLAQRAVAGLKLLQEVGLGYLRLGQPINTLSGGESQRLKLVRHLAEAVVANVSSRLNSAYGTPESQPRSHERSHTLFLFDEPTTGLHFDDVRVLLKVFQRLVDAGHSVVVIEHNLDVIKCADWVVDLGPDAGDEGGQLVVQGTPEDIAACDASHTGKALREVLAAWPALLVPARLRGARRLQAV